MSGDDLPFRCDRCGSFVGQQRLHEADDFGPTPCKRCKKGVERMTNNEPECGEAFDHDTYTTYEDDEVIQTECRNCGAEWWEDKE